MGFPSWPVWCYIILCNILWIIRIKSMYFRNPSISYFRYIDLKQKIDYNNYLYKQLYFLLWFVYAIFRLTVRDEFCLVKIMSYWNLNKDYFFVFSLRIIGNFADADVLKCWKQMYKSQYSDGLWSLNALCFFFVLYHECTKRALKLV